MYAQQAEIEAGILQNSAGDLAIYFDDPAFVRAETIVYDPLDYSLHAILFEKSHFIGRLNPDMAKRLQNHQEILLYARLDGRRVVDLVAPVRISIRH